MSNRPEIWLADLIRAWRALEPDDAAAAHVAHVLGLGAYGPVGALSAQRQQANPPRAEPAPLDPAPSGESTWTAPPASRPTPPLLRPVGTAGWPDEVDWRDASLLDRAPERDQPVDLLLEPLLEPNTAGPVLEAVLATGGPGDEIDIEALVDTIARHRLIEEIPLKTRPSLFRGVHVLVDIAEPMMLFALDQREVVDRLRALIGAWNVRVERFAGHIASGCGPGSVATWKAFEPPPHGTPVLLLSDLGLGTDPDDVAQEWIDLADTLSRRSSQLVALVPYESGRWDALSSELRRSVGLVTWDRSTSVSDVVFRVRR